MWRKFAIALAPVMLLGTAACAQVGDRQDPEGELAAGRADPAARKTPTYREHSSVTDVAPANPAKRGEPAKPSEDLMSRMARDLAQRLDVAVPELQVLAVDPVTWDDGSLGCPQPGQMYVTAQVPGARVLFLHGGKTYQYHASERGQFVYCANPAVPAGSFDRQ